MKKGFITLAVLILLGLPSADCAADSDGPVQPVVISVPIVMYHEVKPCKAGKDAIQPWEFENDLCYLAENGYTAVTMSDLIGYVYSDKSLPEKPIVITFDDGYLNNYIYAFPLLEKYRVKAVLSIIGKNTDDFTDIPDSNPDYSHVTWMQLRELLDSGLVEVQNHTYNLHKSRGRLGCRRLPFETNEEYEKALTDDIMKLQRELTLITGRTPSTFVYPYGKVSDTTDDILRKLGFRATLTCDYGMNRITGDPDSLFRLKRICRAHNEGIGKLLAEVYKTVR